MKTRNLYESVELLEIQHQPEISCTFLQSIRENKLLDFSLPEELAEPSLFEGAFRNFVLDPISFFENEGLW